MTYHERTRVEAVLVLVALKVDPAQGQDLAVVPPEEEDDNKVCAVGDDYASPLRRAIDVAGGDLHDPLGGLALILLDGLGGVDGQEDADAEGHEDEEHVAQHADEAQEDDGVHADLAHENLLLGVKQRRDPGPGLPADGGRRMLLVGVLELGGVDGLVVGSEEGEANGDEDGEADGDAQGREQGRGGELQSRAGQCASRRGIGRSRAGGRCLPILGRDP